MGTRNLTMVIDRKGETKVAQYGQWDGYLDGAGTNILKFLVSKSNRDALEKSLEKVRFFNDEDDKEHDEFTKTIGSGDGWMNSEEAEIYNERYPYLSRDHGCAIIKAIIESEDDSILLGDSTSFAADSLFCEWAYVIDFQKNTFEVYKGFNQSKLDKSERFYGVENEGNEKYHPVKHYQTFSLDGLPTYKKFLSKYNEELENEEE